MPKPERIGPTTRGGERRCRGLAVRSVGPGRWLPYQTRTCTPARRPADQHRKPVCTPTCTQGRGSCCFRYSMHAPPLRNRTLRTLILRRTHLGVDEQDRAVVANHVLWGKRWRWRQEVRAVWVGCAAGGRGARQRTLRRFAAYRASPGGGAGRAAAVWESMCVWVARTGRCTLLATR